MRPRVLWLALLLVVALALAWLLWPARPVVALAADVAPGRVERGEYLVRAGGCITCHTQREGGRPLAGGRALQTPFGTFYTPNLTPDTATGIGAWDDTDFVRALRFGVSPSGAHYYPAFPYPSYAGVTDADLLAIKAYLFSLAPLANAVPSHDLPAWLSFRPTLRVWKTLFFEPRVFAPDPARDAQWNRGAYLVRHLGHCGECHAPRNALGAVRPGPLSGNPAGPDGDAVPGIDAEALADWSRSDIEYLLETGMNPEGDFVGGAMSEVVDDHTSHLSADDRRAIARYLKDDAAGAAAGVPPVARIESGVDG